MSSGPRTGLVLVFHLPMTNHFASRYLRSCRELGFLFISRSRSRLTSTGATCQGVKQVFETANWIDIFSCHATFRGSNFVKMANRNGPSNWTALHSHRFTLQRPRWQILVAGHLLGCEVKSIGVENKPWEKKVCTRLRHS
jgi:hypothetical protein